AVEPDPNDVPEERPEVEERVQETMEEDAEAPEEITGSEEVPKGAETGIEPEEETKEVPGSEEVPKGAETGIEPEEETKEVPRSEEVPKGAETGIEPMEAEGDMAAEEEGEGEMEGSEAAEPMEAEGEEEAEIVEAAHIPKLKPDLSQDVRRALALKHRASRQRPNFRRQEWFRYRRLGDGWRRPRGLHSKMRRHFAYRPPVVSIGYRSPAAARGLHPSGFEEILVHNPKELAALNPKVHAARIAHGVGTKKRREIVAAADEKGIRVLNRGDL
ncbi:MAG: 50S ribosomal protein L32e, partial [Candidatus Thermoplasmatota archaeon]